MAQPVNPVIPWIGGKRRLVGELLPLFPPHTCYVELFAGGAAVFFAKQPSTSEVLNDVNAELANLYRVLRHHLEEFCRQFKFAITSRQTYLWEQMKVPEALTDVQRAARFYYLQRLSFGGRVDGQTYGTSTTGGPRLNVLRMEADLTEAWSRLADANVESLDWQECLARYDREHTLFYADPPYWETEGYGVDFPMSQYEALASRAASMKGTIIISVNDHPEMRRVFGAFPMKTVGINYTVGGGAGVERTELIIGNWRGGWPRPVAQQTAIDWG
ncbi:DNA adenine methylase [Flagellatimonas centrodinii]|uniref:DNA adenine methylase n=1 Tax=Flagellatimonas centrodinii TaxID=2806210 RepID=UPI001FEE8309|nr:DNA adenine methylase [Flagellatimonas centrodinii]ULQ45978.1 DNA adenine methylase [Flagellatimonas centrodinii]